jgi:hypothetical protein
MAIGQKLAGAMGKDPSKGAMTRVSPGVYRDGSGQLVRSKTGRIDPRRNLRNALNTVVDKYQQNQQQQQQPQQAQMIATNLALNGVSQSGNMPQSNQPMQTLPGGLGNVSREEFQQFLESVKNNGGLIQGNRKVDPGFTMPNTQQQPQQMPVNPIAQVQTPGGQGYRYGNPSGTPWQDVSNGVAKGSLRNMAQQARLQQQQAVAQAMQAAQNQQPQATPGRRR